LYTSCVLGLRPLRFFMKLLLIKKKCDNPMNCAVDVDMFVVNIFILSINDSLISCRVE